MCNDKKVDVDCCEELMGQLRDKIAVVDTRVLDSINTVKAAGEVAATKAQVSPADAAYMEHLVLSREAQERNHAAAMRQQAEHISMVQNALRELVQAIKKEEPKDPAQVLAAQREALAAYAHEAWIRWMEYLLGKCSNAPRDGQPLGTTCAQLIPAEDMARWSKQMSTKYADLTEAEKESDRMEAANILALLQELRP